MFVRGEGGPFIIWGDGITPVAMAILLDCYWVGSVDLNFFENQRVFHQPPPKRVRLFAGGSTATKIN